MRTVWTALCLAAFSVAAAAQDLPPASASGPSPFPVQRGTAPAPPGAGAQLGQVPPEGAAAGGLDFGQWRSAQPGAYAARFRQLIGERMNGRDPAFVRADLEANGFACGEGTRLDCRIEIVEGGCAFDWYVVFERSQAAPIAGFDQVCRRRRG